MERKGQNLTTAFTFLLIITTELVAEAFPQRGASPAQGTPEPEGPAALAPRADRRIALDVVVTDRSGKPVPGLQQQDFTILDANQPRTILSFSAVEGTSKAADRPPQAIILVDAVNTWYQGVAYQRAQADEFLRHDGGELPLPMSLFFLSDTSEGQTVITRDRNTLADSLDSKPSSLRTHTRSQGYYGGADRRQISLDALGRLASYEATQPGRKLLIWLGPGWPLLVGPGVQLSGRDLEALFHTVVGLSTALQEARITLYNINPPGMDEPLGREFHYGSFLKGVSSPDQIQNGNLALQVLAVQSGGRVLNASNDIASAITTCLQDAKAFYTLAFDSPMAEHPNEYHNLQVKIGKPGLTARTRAGYYAQP